MNYLDLTLPTPAENLACDEALLDLCEAGGAGEILRFWEPTDYFVVVGYGNRVANEVNIAACKAGGIPVFRRCSGGGTVLQGPGCLNYSLILNIAHGPLQNITSTNRFILERNCVALNALRPSDTASPGTHNRPSNGIPHPRSGIRHPVSGTSHAPQTAPSPATRQGDTDLTIGGLKFSGNAQRRRRRTLLFHGTFLLHFDVRRMEAVLPMPSRQPDYRQGRAHRDFLMNLPLSADAVKRVLRGSWRAFAVCETVPEEKIALLARDKYVKDEWNLKF